MKRKVLSRRNFIEKGAVIAGAILTGTELVSCTIGQKRYKLGIAGDKVVIDLQKFPFLKETWGHGIFVFENHPTLIVLHTEQGFVAFGANCTHKKCVVDWHQDEKHFVCPCHKGRYDIDGKVVSGPPPADLPRYLVHESGDKLEIVKG